MNWLEQRREFSFRIQVCRKRGAQCRHQIGEDVRMQVCRRDGVERAWSFLQNPNCHALTLVALKIINILQWRQTTE